MDKKVSNEAKGEALAGTKAPTANEVGDFFILFIAAQGFINTLLASGKHQSVIGDSRLLDFK